MDPGVCGGHGVELMDADGEPYCDCFKGYTGELCAECISGYQKTGDDCVPRSAQDPDPCGDHGVIAVDSEGDYYCQCDEGYTGDKCGVCSEGYVFNNLIFVFIALNLGCISFNVDGGDFSSDSSNPCIACLSEPSNFI